MLPSEPRRITLHEKTGRGMVKSCLSQHKSRANRNLKIYQLIFGSRKDRIGDLPGPRHAHSLRSSTSKTCQRPSRIACRFKMSVVMSSVVIDHWEASAGYIR